MFCPRLKITPPRLLTKLRGGPFKQYSLFWRKISQFVIFHLSLSWNERWGNLPQNSAVVKMAASPVFPEEELEGEQSHSEECPGTFHCGVLTYFTRKLSFIPKKDCGFIKNLRHLALFMVPLKAAITAPQCSIWFQTCPVFSVWHLRCVIGCDWHLFSSQFPLIFLHWALISRLFLE